jgi:hypothetical protein
MLTAKSATIDGEIAALDAEGRSSFQLLQSYGKTKQTPIVYYTFDLLFIMTAYLDRRTAKDLWCKAHIIFYQSPHAWDPQSKEAQEFILAVVPSGPDCAIFEQTTLFGSVGTPH